MIRPAPLLSMLLVAACGRGAEPADAGAPIATTTASASASTRRAVLDVPVDAASPDGGAPFDRRRAARVTAPAEKSKPPKPAEWEAATELPNVSSACSVKQVREWLRFRCTVWFGVAAQVLGKNEDVFAWVRSGQDDALAEIVFPVRRGDRRMVQVQAASGSYDILAPGSPAFVLSETWLEGEDAATVVVAASD